MSRVGVSPNPLLAWNLLCNSCQRLLKILPLLLTPGFKCTQPYPELELCFEEILQEILALDQYLQSWVPDRSRRTFWSLCVHSQSGSLARPKMRSRYNWFIFVLQLFVLPFRGPEHILMISSTVMSPTIHIIADLYHRLSVNGILLVFVRANLCTGYRFNHYSFVETPSQTQQKCHCTAYLGIPQSSEDRNQLPHFPKDKYLFHVQVRKTQKATFQIMLVLNTEIGICLLSAGSFITRLPVSY